MCWQVRDKAGLPRNMVTFLFDTRGANKMQDYMTWLYKYGIYAAIILGALILAALARNRFTRARFQEMDDSDKLQAPIYEEMDSGIKLSDPEEEEEEEEP